MKPLLLVLLISVTLVKGASACHTLDSDHIYASDLAAASPLFAALNPTLEIGFAPLPGIARVFHPADLLRLARTNGVAMSSAPAEVCFERQGDVAAHSTKASAAPAAMPAPVLVKRGDKVSVTVLAGGVLLKFDAEAESGGHQGDIVMISNPENGNRFPARVQDQGRVLVSK